MYKQVIVVNKGLKMSPGKLGAMVAHGATAFFCEWFKRIVLEVENDAAMKEIIKKAHEHNMVNRQDFFNIVNESTEFLDIPQWAVIAFKPMETEKIDLITGELSLYSEDLPNIKEMLGKQFKDLFLVTEHNATNWEDTDDFWFFLVNDKSEIPMIDNTYRWVNLSSGTISGKVFSTREEAITWATRNRDWEVEGVGEKIDKSK